MSIYLYSIRAKVVSIKVGDGFIHANTLEMLHTNWQAMAGDSDCPRIHAMKQGAARKYWEGRGLPNFVMQGDRLYKWTGEDCFWIDTDRIPGEFWGIVTGPGTSGRPTRGVLARHSCADYPRELYSSKIVCGEPNCRKVLEAQPGEIDAIRARDAEERHRDAEKAAKVSAIWAKTREQEEYCRGLLAKSNDASRAVTHWAERVTRLRSELAAAENSLATVSRDQRGAEAAYQSADKTLNNMREVARAEEARLDAPKVSSERMVEWKDGQPMCGNYYKTGCSAELAVGMTVYKDEGHMLYCSTCKGPKASAQKAGGK